MAILSLASLPPAKKPADAEREVVAKLFQSSIEQVKTEDGNVAYVQRPPSLSADPKDINAQLAALGLGGNQIYKISIGPLDIVVSYDPVNLGISLTVVLNIPILGQVTIGSISGTLTQGISLKIGYAGILSGEVGVRLDGNDVILYWQFTAFGSSYNGSVKLFSI